MGRFDALTQLDKKPLPRTPPPEKAAPGPSLAPSEVQIASKPASTQTDLQVSQQARKPANLQTRLHANRQTNKDAKMQTSKPANLQASKQVNLQTGKQVFIEKYSSYLTHEYKRELKRIAWESDRNEYEVLMEAVELYLTRQRQPK